MYSNTVPIVNSWRIRSMECITERRQLTAKMSWNVLDVSLQKLTLLSFPCSPVMFIFPSRKVVTTLMVLPWISPRYSTGSQSTQQQEISFKKKQQHKPKQDTLCWTNYSAYMKKIVKDGKLIKNTFTFHFKPSKLQSFEYN